ncbi:MAG: transglutaminase-like domain-containing protein, partial [Oscillospiraceae bacterium]|nr:transglutaminase-like domain-containing protein [Oscillospiraceae bacterium]
MLKKSVTLPGFISALFLTWGITSSLLKLYSVEMSFVVTFMLSLLVLLALAAVFYNAVTIITVSASIVVLLVIYAFHFNAVNDYLAVGFTLIADTITFNADITDNGRFLFAALFCVIAAIPSILLFGRLRGALILGLVSGGLFFLELQLGAKNIYPELCAAASAVISVSAGSFARKLNPGGKSKSGVALRVLPLALAATICVTLITPVNADFMHNMAVEIFVDDYVDLFSLNTGFNRSRTVFSLSDYGYGEAQLGGPVSLSGNEVYSVRSSSPALLRVSTKDTYTGYSWESLRDKAQFRFDSPLSDDIRAATFNEGLPAYNVEGMDKLFSKDINTTVTILVPERRSELLNSGRPYGFSGGNITNFIPYFDTDGEVFSKRTLYQGLSYAVNEKLLNFTSAGFATAIQAYEAAVQADKEAGFTPDPEYAEMLRRYTSLPDGIPSGVYDFAALTDGIDSPYLKMLDLRERVSRQSTYTLTPSYVPEGREFVSWFLETREGYCTYYAT